MTTLVDISIKKLKLQPVTFSKTAAGVPTVRFKGLTYFFVKDNLDGRSSGHMYAFTAFCMDNGKIVTLRFRGWNCEPIQAWVEGRKPKRHKNIETDCGLAATLKMMSMRDLRKLCTEEEIIVTGVKSKKEVLAAIQAATGRAF